MKKNVKRLLITLSVAALGVVGLAACGGTKNPENPEKPSHSHTYTDWEFDGGHHWHETTCTEHDAQQADYAAHSYTDGVCTVCSYDPVEDARVNFIYQSVSGGYAIKGLSALGKTKTTFEATDLTTEHRTNITAINAFAFEDATNLKSLSLPTTITSIGREAFSGCTALTTIELGSGITTIENALFLNCSSLTGINLHTGITTIKPGAFEGCSSLTGITLPTGLTSLGEQAFGRCTSLKEITLPANITVINNNMFQNCTSLATVTFRGSITHIGDNAFAHCTSLEEIDLGYNLNYIGQNAFRASGLVEITVPSSVGGDGNNPMQTLNVGAFADCKSLKTATINATLNHIYDQWFSGCSALEELTLPFVGSHKTVTEDTLSTSLGFVFGMATPTDTTNFTKVGNYYIPNSLKKVVLLGGTVSEGSFDGCSMLQEIAVHSGVTVNAETFENCTASIRRV